MINVKYFYQVCFVNFVILYKTYTIYLTRKNCFRYLKFMSPLNKWYYLKKQLFDLEVKGQGPTKVIAIHDTPPYGLAHTYQISLTYLERQKGYGPDKLRWEEAEEAEAEANFTVVQKIKKKTQATIANFGPRWWHL
jgi:hypothetical protein